MTNEKNAELGRPPAGTATTPDRAHDPAGSTPALFQHGHPASQGGSSAGVRSPIVDRTDYPTSDEDAKIYAAIREGLRRSPLLDESAVDLQAEDGVVQLRGQVPSDEARRQLRTIVGNVKGVVEIHDHTDLHRP